MEIHVIIKSVYGREMVYPDCINSRLLCDIARQSTLTENTLQCAADMGYRIVPRHSGLKSAVLCRVQPNQAGSGNVSILAIIAALALVAFAAYGWLSLAAAVLS